ncbi:MAG: TIGR02444 family protein [Pseudomonadota bacterium]
MTDAPKIPESKSPFWRFSVKFYQVPGVAPSCIELQDQAGVDVNVLFFLLWLATQNRALNKEQVAEVERSVGPWREMAVVPIRNVRRALKSPPPVLSAETAEGFRTRIKAVELEAERLQQEALFQIAERGIGDPAASSVEAAKTSVSAYQAVLRPFPAGPLETILAAFANFDPPR